MKNKDVDVTLRDFYQGKSDVIYPYSRFLKEQFSQKVYKVPIHLKGSCPNRDGTCGRGGCIFCGEEGGSFEWETVGSVKNQIEANKIRMKKRYGADKFIAYFQNFTGTYLALQEFKKNIEEAASEDILGINIATRPDALSVEYLEVLSSYPDLLITLELGLQSVNEKTLKILNRGHNVEDFTNAVSLIKQYPFRISTHFILDLPWDCEKDVIRGAQLMNEYQINEVKIHNLYVPEGTKLAIMYRNKEFIPLPMESFIERTILFLEHLNPEIVIGRLTGRAPESVVLHSNWNHSWYYVRDRIIETMIRENRWQGSKCKF